MAKDKDKEKVIPPSKKADTKASKSLRAGGTLGGRVLSEAAIAKKQGVKRPPGK